MTLHGFELPTSGAEVPRTINRATKVCLESPATHYQVYLASTHYQVDLIGTAEKVHLLGLPDT
jgi:hypothetical protein